METITLRNGTPVHGPVFDTTMAEIKKLAMLEPVAFYELTLTCRVTGRTIDDETVCLYLKTTGLIGEDGQPDDVTREIVLAAVGGSGFFLHLRADVVDLGGD